MKFTEAKLEQAFIELLENENFPHFLGNTISKADDEVLIEDRHNNKSTIFTSQMPVNVWHELLSEKTIADAILDRIVHSAHYFEINGYGNSLVM